MEDFVAIIGAGPSGLSTARALSRLNIPFQIFEKQSDLGGLWNIEAEGSPIYDTAHFISSKTMSGHLGFPMPDDYPDYPSNAQIHAYICDFAKANDLTQRIRFNTEVTELARDGDAWRLNIKADGLAETLHPRWVVCASGTNWYPNRPKFKGEEIFEGDIAHSSSYRSPSTLTGKRVLVVGAGNSGADIACDAAFAADKAYISLRRGYHFIPKHVFGEPADVFAAKSAWIPFRIQQVIMSGLLRVLNGDLRNFGLRKPDHLALSSHPIMNTQMLHYLQHGDLTACEDIAHFTKTGVVFKDGKELELDRVILATGYHWHMPYLGDGLVDWQDDRPKLFVNIFAPKYDSLFMNGFVETNGGAYHFFDQISLIIAHVIRGQRDGDSRIGRLADEIKTETPNLTAGTKYIDSPRHRHYVNKDAYHRYLKRFRKRYDLPDPKAFYG